MSRFDRRSTALDVIRQVDLKGKTVAVTGACSGIGAEIARAMAAAGAELIMPARNIEAASAMADTLITDTGNAKIRIYQLDLADFDSIRRFADNLFYDYSRVDILINNAGVLAVPFQLCPQGFELHFSVNHLGHFLLTSVLSKALLASPAPRVVSVSAAAHALSPIIFDDIHFAQRPYDKWLAYAQSKTANILFAMALDRRLAAHGGLAVSVNPGFVISKQQQELARDEMTLLDRNEALKSPAQAAATCVWAATTPATTRLGGSYCENFKVVAPTHCDNATAERLWELSEHLVDAQFAIPTLPSAISAAR